MSKKTHANESAATDNNIDLISSEGFSVQLNRSEIDWEKVEDLDDVIGILKSFNCYFYDDGSERFDSVRHLLKETE